MADHSEVAYTTADGNDYEAHEQTYEGFIMLVKYGTIAVAIILALMAYLPGLIRRPRRWRSENSPQSGPKTGIQRCGKSASLRARASPAPPEAP